jgi:GTPase
MTLETVNLSRVLLVGRPNVGKSSLFNAMLGYRRTIVLDMPGTTVDFIWEKYSWDDASEKRQVLLGDTRGIMASFDMKQVTDAFKDIQAVLFVVDAVSGITPDDQEIARQLHRAELPVLMVVNKTDASRGTSPEFYELGFAELVETSASHRAGIDAIQSWMKPFSVVIPEPEAEAEEIKEPVKLAILGRPNAGKSTLVNLLAGRAVSEVSPKALTTRDPVHVEIEFEGNAIKLLDTAGLRRPRSRMEQVEKFSVNATTRTIREADVVLMMIASHEAITDQDMRVLNLLQREGKPCAVLLNFWDELDRDQRDHFLKDSEFAPYLKDFKVVPISAKTGFQVDQILPLACQLRTKATQRVKTAKLNEVLKKLLEENPPPSIGRYHFNILYASQVKVDPPTFVFFTNRAHLVPDSYQRYLEKRIRDRFGYKSQAVRLIFRSASKRTTPGQSASR